MNTENIKHDTTYFKAGIDPNTGEAALRVRIYEVLKTFPKTRLRPADIADFVKDSDAAKIANALHQLILPASLAKYPHIHRVERGVYMYDSDMAQTVVHFPSMSKAQRKAQRRRRARSKQTGIQPSRVAKSDIAVVADATVTAATPSLVLPPKDSHPSNTSTVADFVASFPVFSEQAGTFLSTDEVVMLRDSQGRTWLAKRV